jgi:hypothetical protein
LTINVDFIATKRHSDSFANLDINTRVLVITENRSFSDAFRLIKSHSFLTQFLSLPFAFVIVLKCESGGTIDRKDFGWQLLMRYRKACTRPLVISFEHEDHCQLFYRNHDGNFVGFENLWSIDEPEHPFHVLLRHLTRNERGIFTGFLLDTQLERDPELVNDAVREYDILCLRFLYLFDHRQRPRLELLGKFFSHDFCYEVDHNHAVNHDRDHAVNDNHAHVVNLENPDHVIDHDHDHVEDDENSDHEHDHNDDPPKPKPSPNLTGFTTLFDFGFIDAPSDHIRGDLTSSSMQPRDRQIILDFIHSDMNFLMHAVVCRNASAVELFINTGIDVNGTNGESKMAIDYAATAGHHELTLRLLLANSRHPSDFDGRYLSVLDNMNMTDEKKKLQDFVEATNELHEKVLSIGDINENHVSDRDQRLMNRINQIINQYPGVRYFYNVDNDSIATVALERKKFGTYRHLLSKDLLIGPFEDFRQIKRRLCVNRANIQRIADIHLEMARDMPNQHIAILIGNTFVCHDNLQLRNKLELIERAFRDLDDMPLISVLLRVVAATRNFKIIFDFNRDSVEYANPTGDPETFGLFELHNSQRHIYIGARRLLCVHTRLEVMATIGHEFCHYALQQIYGNSCIPFRVNDDRCGYEAIAGRYWNSTREKWKAMDEVIRNALR